MAIIHPYALRSGDRVAAVSLSWGGPAAYPARYAVGKQQFEDEFGLTVVEMPCTLKDPDWLARNPEARAHDLMMALEDASIAGVICTVGGDDSIRTLPFVDLDIIRANPKPFVGYSDSTVTHLAFLKAGVVSFYGPALMAGFAENGGMHEYLRNSFRRALFLPEPIGRVDENTNGWTVEFLDWADPANQNRVRNLTPTEGWKFLQGTGVHRGRLIGGCFEAFDWLRGTAWWPNDSQWDQAILFLETSEEGIAPVAIARTLRVYAEMGVLSRISGLLFGRPGGQLSPAQFAEYDDAITRVVRDEVGLGDLPIITRMDFGHTDPIMTLPVGAMAEIDCDQGQLRISESAVVARGAQR